MFAYYCASLESSLKAGGSLAKLLPKWDLLPWGLDAAFSLQVSLLKWIKQNSAWWARGSELMAWRTCGAGAKHDSGPMARLMWVADTHPYTLTRPKCTHACCLPDLIC